jgi:D-amino-acid dehydrogenase
MATPRWKADVAVVGAGAIGASVAAELAARGRSVVVLEKGTAAAGCSWGNAGLVCPSHAGPYATSADLGNAIRWLFSPTSPLGIAPRPGLVPFLAEVLAATRPSVAGRALDVSRRLCARSLELHEQLLDRGIATGLRRAGLLDTYETPQAFARAQQLAERHREQGLAPRILDVGEVRRAEPALGPAVVGGVLFPDEAHCDPVSFVSAVGQAARERGARLVSRAEVLSFDSDDRECRLQTTAGDVVARTIVLATGAWTARVAGRRAGWMPLQSGKGYTVDLDAEDRELPTRPFLLQESRIAVTPLGDRLRLAGMMQFTGLDQRISRRRIAGIRGPAARLLPTWSDAPVVALWAGLRPCTPDGLPYLGWLDAHQRIVVCAGHAMLGLTLAPLSGVQVADLLDQKPVEFAEHLSPRRFGVRARARRPA